MDSHAASPSVLAPEAGFLAVVRSPKVRFRRFASAKHGIRGSLSYSSQQVEGYATFLHDNGSPTCIRLPGFGLRPTNRGDHRRDAAGH